MCETQVVAYKAGSVFAGGLLLWLRDLAGWGSMFAAFAAIYGVAVALFRHYRLADRSIREFQKLFGYLHCFSGLARVDFG